MIRVRLGNIEIEKINAFANAIDTGYYATRNQFNADKRKIDQIVCKFGEFSVFSYLSSKYEISEPDLKIYSAREKSWDFDLKGNGINIHVKSQSRESGDRFGISWVFQNSDREIFNSTTQDQYVAFVSVDVNSNCSLIRTIVKLEDLHAEKLFKSPKLDYLKSNKFAVYYEDIKHKEIIL